MSAADEERVPADRSVASSPFDGDAARPAAEEPGPGEHETWPEAAATAAATIASGLRVGLRALGRLVAELRVGAVGLRLGERPRAVRLAAGASAVVLIGIVALALGGAALGGPAAAPEVTPRVTNGPVAGAEAAAVLDRFLAALEAPRSYEARMRGTVERAQGKVRESLTGKVAGSAYDVRLRTTRADGTATEVRVVVRGKGTWIRRDDRRWSRPKTRPANLAHADVFRGLASPAQLLHLGVEQRRGHVTHHLRTSATWISPLGARWIAAYPSAIVDRSTLDIWVLPDGRPIEVAHAFAARWPAPFVGGTIAATSTWVILRYGEPVTVTPPR